MNCPCTPSKNYEACCKIAHHNQAKVHSAEQLMRSRYSAFVLADVTYLYNSHHSQTRPSKKEHQEIKSWSQSVQWLKLEVLNATETTVEFKAFYMEQGKVLVIHENSEFTKEQGNWVYKGALQ